MGARRLHEISALVVKTTELSGQNVTVRGWGRQDSYFGGERRLPVSKPKGRQKDRILYCPSSPLGALPGVVLRL